MLNINQGMIEVIATSGNNCLGGDDFISKKLSKDDRERLDERVKLVKKAMKEKNQPSLSEACRELSQMLSLMETSSGTDNPDGSGNEP